jgi:hypothetical protein
MAPFGTMHGPSAIFGRRFGEEGFTSTLLMTASTAFFNKVFR